jgi:hypothetical protein
MFESSENGFRPGEQGRQDSNLQPPVLETGALPIELRPWVRAAIVSGGLRPACCAPDLRGRGSRRLAVAAPERNRHVRAKRGRISFGNLGIIRRVGSLGLAVLFAVLTCAFAGIAVAGGLAGQWVIALAAGALAAWMGSLASTVLRKSRR